MKIENLSDLLVHTLKDIYFAEKQIVKALPKMAKATDSSELQRAFESHLEETKEQIVRLEKVFELLGKKAVGEKCPAIEGILAEGEELMKEIKEPDTRDAAMIAAAQAVEHYEITRYGTLVSWAELLGLKDVAKILAVTLKEEHAADAKLNKLAEGKLNKQAAA
jgi:ferritin-like metal-binding protein YciE